MSETFRLAHISDVHLPNVSGFWPWHWNIKRGLGFLNWHRKRRFIHRQRTVDLLLRDLRDQQFDHIAVSGDLANIGLPSELAAATTWLRSLGDPRDVTVIPGNHDIYCRLQSDIGTQRWHAYMRDGGIDPQQSDEALPAEFPFVRRLGPIALIGVNSAVPTPPGIASGEVGRSQLDRLKQILLQLGNEDCCRVVMVHHPPLPGQAANRRALRDAADMQQVLQEAGADLVIHGHNHRSMLAECRSEDGAFPIVGVPSFSAASSAGHGELAAYNIYEIATEPEGCAITLIQRGLKRDAEGVFELRAELISGLMHKQS